MKLVPHPLAKLAWLYQTGSGKRTVELPAGSRARIEDWTVVTACLGARRKALQV